MAVRRVLSKLRGGLWRARSITFRLVETTNRRASTFASAPFPDQAEFGWVSSVERCFPAIQAELLSVQASETIPNFQEVSEIQRELTSDDRWKTFFLYGYGHRDEHNCALCPATDRALQQIPGLMTAMFSILSPGKTIPPHRGPYNGVLRYHLGLVVPDQGTTSGIRVDDQTRHWTEGESLIFDDTFEHEAWNTSDQQRVVLFVDFERPTRFPVSVVNKAVIAAIRRSGLVQDAVGNIRRHRDEHAVRTDDGAPSV